MPVTVSSQSSVVFEPAADRSEDDFGHAVDEQCYSELSNPPDRLRKKPGDDVRTRYCQRYTEVLIHISDIGSRTLS
ncbi:hypothetical protein RRF57_006594 [Xylaria bambusicola]|uniref:Uncharacterized protein n=1 Tax=Xylaria bambusicola TaxID=326684 RepID=A0AAN7UP36_9PEZI